MFFVTTFVLYIVGVRDYIHVEDLAIGHVAAQKKIEECCGLKVMKINSLNNNLVTVYIDLC